MVARQVTICDVYGATEGVNRYKITIDKASYPEPIRTFELDLSERALDRLIKKIEDGTTPPSKRKKDNAS